MGNASCNFYIRSEVSHMGVSATLDNCPLSLPLWHTQCSESTNKPKASRVTPAGSWRIARSERRRSFAILAPSAIGRRRPLLPPWWRHPHCPPTITRPQRTTMTTSAIDTLVIALSGLTSNRSSLVRFSRLTIYIGPTLTTPRSRFLYSLQLFSRPWFRFLLSSIDL